MANALAHFEPYSSVSARALLRFFVAAGSRLLRATSGRCAGGVPAPAAAVARDVYVYFDNDAKVRAPFDALALEDKVKHLLRTGGSTRTARRT